MRQHSNGSRLWTNRKAEHGLFNIIGDIHGCYDELRALLLQLGYEEHEPLVSAAATIGEGESSDASRPVVIVCRDEAAAAKTFGVSNPDGSRGQDGGEGLGIVYTRTGRRFFDDAKLEAAFLARLRAAADASGLWEELQTDWLCLDCELMPWSAKAQELLKDQYAAVGAAAGAAAGAALPDAVAALARAEARGIDVSELLARFNARAKMIGEYVAAYRRYCWPVSSINDLKLAPFHLLASAGAVHADKDHIWHMETLRRLCAAAPDLLLATPYKIVEVNDEASVQAGVAWSMALN